MGSLQHQVAFFFTHLLSVGTKTVPLISKHAFIVFMHPCIYLSQKSPKSTLINGDTMVPGRSVLNGTATRLEKSKYAAKARRDKEGMTLSFVYCFTSRWPATPKTRFNNPANNMDIFPKISIFGS